MTQNEPLDADSPSRFAQLAADTFLAVSRKLAPEQRAARQQVIDELLEGHEAEAATLARSILGPILDHPDMTDTARPVFELLLKPEHQTQAILTVLGVYPIVSAFVMAAVAPFVQDISNMAWAGHTSVPLAPAELALAKLRDNLGDIDPYKEAAQSGYDGPRFDVLVGNTGEPPGLMQMLELYRRRRIDRPTLERAIKQSRVRDEWIPYVEDLQFTPPSPMEAVAGAVKGHLTDDDARVLFTEGGYAIRHYDWMRATAGRPPGAVEMLQLLNRKQIDEKTFGDAIRQSDIQDRWIPDLLNLRWYVPPPRSIVSMLRHNAITPAKARELLAEHGVRPADIELFINEAASQRTQAHHELSVSQIEQAYIDGFLNATTAHARLTALGYDDATATLIIELTDEKVVQRFRSASVTRVHRQYVTHRIAVNDASSELDALGVHGKQRDELLRLWTVERDSTPARLTLAQCQGLWHRGVMSDAEFATRVEQLGYHASDVRYLMALAIPPSKFPTLRGPASI